MFLIGVWSNKLPVIGPYWTYSAKGAAAQGSRSILIPNFTIPKFPKLQNYTIFSRFLHQVPAFLGPALSTAVKLKLKFVHTRKINEASIHDIVFQRKIIKTTYALFRANVKTLENQVNHGNNWETQSCTSLDSYNWFMMVLLLTFWCPNKFNKYVWLDIVKWEEVIIFS